MAFPGPFRPRPAGLVSVLLILVLLLGLAPVALGQDREEEAQRTAPDTPKRVQSIEKALEGKRHQGPLFLWMAFALEKMGYDSNLFNDEEDEIGSFTMTLSPELQVMLPVGAHHLFQASGKLGLVLHNESPPGNYLNAFGTLKYDLYRNRFHFSLADHYVRDRRRQNTEFNQRILMTSNEVNGELALRVATRVNSGFSYGLNSVRFDSGAELEDSPGLSLAEILDRDEHTASWRTRIDFSSRVNSLIDLSLTDYRFKMPGNIRESYEWSGSFGLEIDEGARVTGLAEIGYAVFKAREVEDQDFSGVLWTAALDWQMSQRFHLLLESRRNRNFSAFADNLYFLNLVNQPTIRIHMQDTTWFGLGYAWSNSTYPVEGTNLGTVEEPLFVAREDDITGPVVTFRHQTGKSAGKLYTMGMEARYLERESNTVNNYERFFVYVSFQVEQ